MKKSMKFILSISLVLGFAIGAFGGWNGTFYVVVQEGHDDCDYPAYEGIVTCYVFLGDNDSHGWHGYTTYTFYLEAPYASQVEAGVTVHSTWDPYQTCFGTDAAEWSSPPLSGEIYLTVEPEIVD